ncbi:MAG: L,D-transpeptidase family protein [Planctomycetota bacterium]|nr:L,D-transpeptidase family protein [Planctomycetota bacterium]
MALGSQSGQQIGRNKYMYRRRKGRSGKWLVVLVVLAGGGVLFWLSLPGPRSTQASQEPTRALVERATAQPATNEPRTAATPPSRPSVAPPQAPPSSPPPATAPNSPPRGATLPAEQASEASSRADRASELLAGGLGMATDVPARAATGTTDPAAVTVVVDAPGSTGATDRLDELEELAGRDPISARSELTELVIAGDLPPGEAFRARMILNRLGEILMFDPSVLPQDPFAAKYVVQPGDSLSRIAKNADLKSEWMMIKRINRITNPNSIRVGQSLKIPVGTFHAVVSKSDYLLDLFLENDQGRVLIASCPVGLGEFDATPVGRFVVREQSKLINPQWRNPRTGEFFYSDDPENPIGERWIGIRGIDETNQELLGYGIHGTIDADSIGRMESMGCIRMHDPDVKLVYDALTERGSIIEIRP